MFRPVNPSVNWPEMETRWQQWWQEQGTLRAYLQGEPDAPKFVFYEGPPTANGRPGVHHVLARVFKDVVLRYHRLKGERILGARGGWDTHGLPVEIEIEKELGFSGKGDIERYGIAEFNKKCRESAFRYIKDWERMTDRIAFWIDPGDAYITYTNEYVETGWWILRTLWDRGLLFRDYRVSMHCPRCNTSLADHEVSLGFRDEVEDPSVWIKFRLQTENGELPSPLADLPAPVYVLAWTTTPWTLPANVALALAADEAYVVIECDEDRLIVAAARLAQLFPDGGYTTLRTLRGRDLEGLHYEPLFRGVPASGDNVDWGTAYVTINDKIVSMEEGTGIVHIAPAYGDLDVGRRHGLPTLFSVDLEGKVLPDFAGFGGMFFKEADPLITQNLEERGLLLRSGRVTHAYPFCWRCGTPLLYYAKGSWYIRTTAVKDRLIAGNQQIRWYPAHIRDGRFGDWLENNVDWALSRERYWGTPLPIWQCQECGQQECIGGVAELSDKAGRDLSGLDLHRPYVDEVTWACEKCGGTMQRLPEVLDCWYDSGAMPYAQWHYPYGDKSVFEANFPADFISEAMDQTRGWFYSLHALSTLLFDQPCYKNVICLGLILDADGQKMSKSRGNVVDPWSVLEAHGADPLRWYLFTAGPPGNARRFSTDLVGESLRRFLLTLWNTYSFFVLYANLDKWTPNRQSPIANPQLMDRWLLARLNAVVGEATHAMDAYDITAACRALDGIVDDLSNWYVRLNRRRFWKAGDDADKDAAYGTLYTALATLARLVAPFTPFVAEEIYQNLVRTQDASAPASVHLARWPAVETRWLDEELVADMATTMRVVRIGRAVRRQAGLKVRQPLRRILVRPPHSQAGLALQRLQDAVLDELNVKELQLIEPGAAFETYHLKPNLPVVGPKHGRTVPAIRAALGALSAADAAAAVQAIGRGQAFDLSLPDGNTVSLGPEDVLVETAAPAGFRFSEEEDFLVALDTTLDEALTLEGLARELVRQVQEARKEAGLAVSDRIYTYLTGASAQVAKAIAAHRTYILGETLSLELHLEEPPAGAYRKTVAVEEEENTLGIVAVPQAH
jgi:isoleucyl-tRNA synthetase